MEKPDGQADNAPLAYCDASTPAEPVPRYRGLFVAAKILKVMAFVLYAMSILAFAAFSPRIASALVPVSGQQSLRSTLFWMVRELTPIASLATAGAAGHALSATCLAVRDIARNSWR